MEKQIRDIISHYCGGTHENKQIATKQILNLFNVSNCDHSKDGTKIKLIDLELSHLKNILRWIDR